MDQQKESAGQTPDATNKDEVTMGENNSEVKKKDVPTPENLSENEHIFIPLRVVNDYIVGVDNIPICVMSTTGTSAQSYRHKQALIVKAVNLHEKHIDLIIKLFGHVPYMWGGGMPSRRKYDEIRKEVAQAAADIGGR